MLMSPMRDGTTSEDRATQLLICEPLSFANSTLRNLLQHKFQLQTAISRKRNDESYIRWCQNSSLVEGFHLLFHESGVAPLFHPLSDSFGQKNHFFGVFQVCQSIDVY